MIRREYSSDVYSDLNDFFVARERLKECEDALSTLGEVICHHNVHHLVGIALLHKHFNLEFDERLVEEFANNRFCTRPYFFSKSTPIDTTPYLWKVEEGESGQWAYFPLEFVRPSSALDSVRTASHEVISNQPFLEDMAKKLLELSLTDVFGITILHRNLIKLGDDEIIVETTDDEARVLTCAGANRDKLDPDSLTQTVWQFTENQSVNAAGACIAHNRCSHCVRHCRHCINHG